MTRTLVRTKPHQQVGSFIEFIRIIHFVKLDKAKQ